MSIPAELIDRARQAGILETANRFGQLKRAGAKEYFGPCPVCGGSDRFSVNTRKQIWNCRGCGKGGDVISLIQHAAGVTFVEAVASLAGEEWNPPASTRAPRSQEPAGEDKAKGEAQARRAAAIIRELVPIRGTPGERYLREKRRIDTDAIADALERVNVIGWHPQVYFNEPGHALHEKRLGSIVGVMTDPITAAPTGGVSRTYLHDGWKVMKAKSLGRTGIVRLSPDEDVLEGLFIAEGVETALDAMAKNARPMWSTGGAGLMAKFPVLAGVEALTVIADHDENGAGEKAAREVAARWLEVGREAHVRMWAEMGDANDAFRKLDEP